MSGKESNTTMPIGVFDSGVGGLSILKHLIKDFPNESFIYLGDTARLPYGTKSQETILNYAQKNIDFLIKNYKVKAVVIACNSASTVADSIQSDIPIFDVIRPGAQAACNHLAQTHENRVGLWATEATVRSKAYEREIHEINSNLMVDTVSCPTLVSLVEEDGSSHPLLKPAFDYYLSKLNQKTKTLILGCTHFPIFKDILKDHISDRIHLIDSGGTISTRLKNELKMSSSPSEKSLKILLTDSTHRFNTFAETLLKKERSGFDSSSIEKIDL